MIRPDVNLIKNITNKVKDKFENEGSGHDWWHIYRVWQNGSYCFLKRCLM